MDDFLAGFASERQALLDLVDRADTAWTAFRRTRSLDVDTTAVADGLIAGELAAVRREVTARQLSVGVFGLIKRGKSTLLNALVGHAVSATHATPETAVPVFVDAGHRRGATVHLADGRSLNVDLDDLPRFTSQKSQPDERLGVAYVHARVPSSLLAAGVRMIDTPGLDDAEVDETYTARTLQQLEAVDAGVLVVMSPPTVGATEMRFLQELARRRGREFVLVCNMVPQHFHDPLARQQILDYIADRLAQAGLGLRLRAVCAVEAWEARRAGDTHGWERSGAGELLRDLEHDLTVRAGRRAVDAAYDRLKEALRLAAAEVQLQRSLLASPETLTTYRGEAHERIAAVGRETQDAVDHRLRRLGPLSTQFRDLLFQRFFTAKQEIADAGSLEDLERLLRRVRRQVEVTSELAARQARQVVGAIVERLQADLGSDAGAVLAGSGVALPEPSAGPLAEHEASHHAINPELGGAAVGGVVGGLGLAVLGVTLGPIGLIGGALVGWRLGGVLRSGRTLAQARALAVERLDGLLDAIADEFDRHLAVQTDAVRTAVRERYTALTADLTAQVAAVEHLMAHPELVSARNAECDRILAVLRDLTDAASATSGSVRPQPVTA